MGNEICGINNMPNLLSQTAFAFCPPVLHYNWVLSHKRKEEMLPYIQSVQGPSLVMTSSPTDLSEDSGLAVFLTPLSGFWLQPTCPHAQW
jgi:hypothetical protein